MLGSICGCSARWQQNCACGLDEFDLTQTVHNLCSASEPLPCGCTVGCSDVVEEGYVEFEEVGDPAPALCTFDEFDRALDLKRRIAIGPPAVRYRPPMPPKFLTVPTRPFLAPVNLNAPLPANGTVEVDFGSQLAFPGR